MEFQFISGAYFGGEASPKCRVHTFQAFGRNSWSTPITKLAGQLEIDGTGEKFPLLFNKDGKPVDIKEMPPVGNDERVGVVCYFVRDQSLWGTSKGGIEANSFLGRYTPFTLVVSVNGEEETKYPFSTEDCRALIQSFVDEALRRK